MSKRGTSEFPPRRSTAWKRAALLLVAVLALACNDAPSAPRTGSLVVNVSGLPAGAQNAVTVTGPAGGALSSRTVNVTDTLENLPPGNYTLTANTVTVATGTYVATTPSQQVEVIAAGPPSTATVRFEITTGSIAINVTGLPDGAAAAVSVTGTGGFSRQVTATALLAGLEPGAYLISSNTVTVASGHLFSPTPLSQAVTVIASETPRTVTSRYALATGALDVVVTGLPASQSASVTVSGPGGLARTLNASTTLAGLMPGTYAVVAASVTGSTTWSPTVPAQNVDVAASLTPVRAEVNYVDASQPTPPSFNLTIDGMYVTQAVQTYGGTVPLIANMPALVRVFVKASAPNLVGATVRLRLFNGVSPLETMSLSPNVPGAPTSIAEGTLSSSWNAIIPASYIQPGLRLVADVDPGNAITETDESDNAFPANGTFHEPSIAFPPPLNITLVPVAQASTGLTGNLTPANLGDYMAFARKVFPIRDYQITLHEPLATSTPPLESNDGNNAWFQVLGEINALRVAEGSSDYFMGIVATPYSSGIAGLAFTPGKAAVSWDRTPTAPQITAHELGHSFGRRHAPCGGVTSPDPLYPHASGSIGVFGYDIATGLLKFPGTSDLMGYCGFGWVSDYTYTGILNYRASTPTAAVAEPFVRTDQVQATLVVWGRIEHGKPVLEPAFAATTRPVLPSRSGPHRVEGHASDGRRLFSYAFEGEEPGDHPDPTARHFAFAIPMSGAESLALDRIRLTTASGEQTTMRAAAGDAGSVDATVEAPGRIRFRVTDASTRLAVVRDRGTGRILAFVRGQGPAVVVRSRATEFDVQLADGVRSRLRQVRARVR
jgi:hypothetical protein